MYLCDYRTLCLSTQKKELQILTVTKVKQQYELEVKEFQELNDLQIYTAKHKKVRRLLYREYL